MTKEQLVYERSKVFFQSDIRGDHIAIDWQQFNIGPVALRERLQRDGGFETNRGWVPFHCVLRIKGIL